MVIKQKAQKQVAGNKSVTGALIALYILWNGPLPSISGHSQKAMILDFCIGDQTFAVRHFIVTPLPPCSCPGQYPRSVNKIQTTAHLVHHPVDGQFAQIILAHNTDSIVRCAARRA